MWFIALFLIGIHLMLSAIVAFVRQPNRLQWGGYVLSFGLVIGFMWISAPWAMISMHLRWVLPLLFVGACVVGYRRIRMPEKRPGKIQAAIPLFINGFMILLMAGLSWRALIGYPAPEGVIDLASPLRNGAYVVGHGGTSPFINAHAKVRPQNYALDILGVNAWGRHKSRGASDNILEQYAIFGATLYSPCEGVVVRAVDGLPDLIPPQRDPENLAGNYVEVACHGVEVVLAHMQQGSVQVAEGDTVTTETVLGKVGNTGNTSEPHLHIHAERGGEPGQILQGEAVPITLDGRFLVRNDRLGK